MEYTKEQINFIQSKRPELEFKEIPNLDDVIIEFLKKFEVYVKPLTTGKRTSGDFASTAVAGAIGGMAGADVAGDAFLISGQIKQTQIQEWTQWKQWALSHKDFESFRAEKIDNLKAYNEEVQRKLKDPDFQKELEPIFEQFKKEEKEANRVLMIVVPIFLFAIVGIPLIVTLTESKNDDTSFNPIIKNEKIQNYIS